MADGRSWMGLALDSRESGDETPVALAQGRADRDVPRSGQPLQGARLVRRGHSLFGLRNRKQ